MNASPSMERLTITGAALRENLARVTLHGTPDRPGVVAQIFTSIGAAGINVDDIIQTGLSPSRTPHHGTVSFTILEADLEQTTPIVDHLARDLDCERSFATGFAKVSIAGLGIRSHAGAAATMFQAIASKGINIDNISTSEIKISAFVPNADGREALRAVHEAFELDQVGGGDGSSEPTAQAAQSQLSN